MSHGADILLTEAEIEALCPDVHQPAAIVRHLHGDGFTRARIREGRVILERAHYDAVCRGQFGASQKAEHNRPQLRPIK